MTDNEALVEILEELRAIEEDARNEYDAVYGSNSEAVTNAVPYERDADDEAIKTVVTNLGDDVVRIFEGEALVKMLDINETWVSPLSGGGAILIDCAGGSESATIAIATFTKAAA